MDGWVYGASVALGAAAIWMTSGTQREKPIVSVQVERLRELEARAAPRTVEATVRLAQAYLDAHQPGLAVALAEVGPELVRNDVRVRHVYARALVDEGHNDEALAVEAGVLSACRPVLEDKRAPDGCDRVILASAMRRTGILRELVAIGVEDSQARPAESLVAYQNATREAHVVVE
ncbi:MAG: hypothetical protein ABSC94_11095 [Polyangiaceae bacterium]|jgi:hypothetical protein